MGLRFLVVAGVLLGILAIAGIFPLLLESKFSKGGHEITPANGVSLFSVSIENDCQQRFFPIEPICVICPMHQLRIECMQKTLSQYLDEGLDPATLAIFVDDFTLFNQWKEEEILEMYRNSGHAILLAGQSLDEPHMVGDFRFPKESLEGRDPLFPNIGVIAGRASGLDEFLKIAYDLSQKLLTSHVSTFDYDPPPKAVAATFSKDRRNTVQSHTPEFLIPMLTMNAYSSVIGVDQYRKLAFVAADVTRQHCTDKTIPKDLKRPDYCEGKLVEVEQMESNGKSICEYTVKKDDTLKCGDQFFISEECNIINRGITEGVGPFVNVFWDDNFKSTFQDLLEKQRNCIGNNLLTKINTHTPDVKKPYVSEIIKKHLTAFHKDHPEYGGWP